MSDNSSAEKGALSDTWPSAKQLLCTFHVLQAEWRWLTSARNEVTKEDRRQYMERFQKVRKLWWYSQDTKNDISTFP